MSKILCVGLIAVLLLSGCNEQEKDTSKESDNLEQTHAVKDKQNDANKVTPLTVDGIEIPDLSTYQLHASEYEDLNAFMEQSIEDWKDGSEYKTKQDEGDAEDNLAISAIHYINYFEEEIDKLGLTEDFKELQIIAYKVDYNFTFNINKEGYENQQETFVKEFTTKLNEIYSKM